MVENQHSETVRGEPLASGRRAGPRWFSGPIAAGAVWCEPSGTPEPNAIPASMTRWSIVDRTKSRVPPRHMTRGLNPTPGIPSAGRHGGER